MRKNRFKNATSFKLSLFQNLFEPEEGTQLFFDPFFLSASDTNCQITFLFQQHHHQRGKLHVQKIAKSLLGGVLEAMHKGDEIQKRWNLGKLHCTMNSFGSKSAH